MSMMDVNISQLTMFSQFLKERATKSENCSDAPKIKIPKSVADELKVAIGSTNFENTPYSVQITKDNHINIRSCLMSGVVSENTYKFCHDNTKIFDAYLNPLTRQFVEVSDD